MKLLHLTGKAPQYFIMVLDEEEEKYKYMRVAAGEPDDVMAEYPLADYEDRNHFAGVIGKFMPYTWILSEEAEIDIEEPSLPELRRAAEILQERKNSRF